MTDLERLRLRLAGLVTPDLDRSGSGAPAFVGKVTTAAPAVGQFLLVNPVDVFGTETEGSAGAFAVQTGASVPVYLLGPGVPATGDLQVCRFVDFRWVTERTGGSVTPPVKIEATFTACSYPIPNGTPIVVTQGGTVVASGVTISNNFTFYGYPSTTYTYSSTAFPSPRFTTYSITTGTGSTQSFVLAFPTGSGYECAVGCPQYPLATTLHISGGTLGSDTLTWTSYPYQWANTAGTITFTYYTESYTSAGYILNGYSVTYYSCALPISITFGTLGTVTE